MNKIVGAIAALAVLGLAGTASAEEANGTITSVDLEARTIVLESGETFTVGEAVAIEMLQPGTDVTVSYEMKDGANVASEVMTVE